MNYNTELYKVPFERSYFYIKNSSNNIMKSLFCIIFLTREYALIDPVIYGLISAYLIINKTMENLW